MSWPPSSSLILLIGSSASLLGLALGQPFYYPSCSPDRSPTVTEFVAGNSRLRTAVGNLNKARSLVVSRQRTGVALFGPHVSLPRGIYRVEWTGVVWGPSSPRFEVFSPDRGIVATARPALKASRIGRLQELRFVLNSEFDGFEFRVIATRKDHFAVRIVRLTSISCGSP